MSQPNNLIKFESLPLLILNFLGHYLPEKDRRHLAVTSKTMRKASQTSSKELIDLVRTAPNISLKDLMYRIIIVRENDDPIAVETALKIIKERSNWGKNGFGNPTYMLFIDGDLSELDFLELNMNCGASNVANFFHTFQNHRLMPQILEPFVPSRLAYLCTLSPEIVDSATSPNSGDDKDFDKKIVTILLGDRKNIKEIFLTWDEVNSFLDELDIVVLSDSNKYNRIVTDSVKYSLSAMFYFDDKIDEIGREYFLEFCRKFQSHSTDTERLLLNFSGVDFTITYGPCRHVANIFSGYSLRYMSFNGCNLSNIRFVFNPNRPFIECDFSDANLEGAIFMRERMTEGLKGFVKCALSISSGDDMSEKLFSDSLLNNCRYKRSVKKMRHDQGISEIEPVMMLSVVGPYLCMGTFIGAICAAPFAAPGIPFVTSLLLGLTSGTIGSSMGFLSYNSLRKKYNNEGFYSASYMQLYLNMQDYFLEILPYLTYSEDKLSISETVQRYLEAVFTKKNSSNRENKYDIIVFFIQTLLVALKNHCFDNDDLVRYCSNFLTNHADEIKLEHKECLIVSSFIATMCGDKELDDQVENLKKELLLSELTLSPIGPAASNERVSELLTLGPIVPAAINEMGAVTTTATTVATATTTTTATAVASTSVSFLQQFSF